MAMNREAEAEAEDAKSLHSFSVFLTGCNNVVNELEYLEEMNSPSNLRIIVHKLPFRLRERWRVIAFDIQEKEGRRADFADLVGYINRQAKIASDPLFGDVKDPPDAKEKCKSSAKSAMGRLKRTTGLATSVTPADDSSESRKTKQTSNAFQEPCLYCNKGHTLSACNKIRARNIQLSLTRKERKTATKQLPSLRRQVKAFPVNAQLHENKCHPRVNSQQSPWLEAVTVRGLKCYSVPWARRSLCPASSFLEVCGLTESKYISLPYVYTHTDLPVTRENVPAEKDLESWPYLRKEVQLPQIDADVEMLIGMNAHSAMEPWKIIHSQDDGSYAIKTTLGWVVNGPLKKDNDNKPSHFSHGVSVNRVSVSSVDSMLLRQYNHDFPEQACEEKSEMSREDIQFMRCVTETTKKINGHYCIGMPLRNKDVVMPNNKCVAEQRASSLKRNLAKNSSFHDDYTAFVSDLLSKGYAVEVPANELNRNDGRVWYIPHHGVIHPQKGKLQVVFDCASSFQGKSLNEELLQGPDLTNSLVGVLTRFRHDHIALISDIEAMYHQVRVTDEDSNLLRFLWWPEGDLNQPLREYKMVVHLFGAKSSLSCANYALRRTAEDGKDRSSPEAVTTVLEHFYVDDCLVSASDKTKATSLTKDLIALCASRGFHLAKWSSNSHEVLSSFPENERAKKIKNLDLDRDKLPMERALGVDWCIESDSFKFCIFVKNMPVTRRGILSIVSSIYDPLGFLSPFILLANTIMQNLCRMKLTWDDEIPEDLANRWCAWLSDLSQFASFSVKRCIKPEGFGPVVSAQLHHFSDASEKGDGVVSYIRIENSHGQVHCSFLLGKSRVTPLKPVTVPCLELTVATIAVKMDKLMKRKLRMDLKDSVLWTDSTTVLRYIDNDGARFKTFVANSVDNQREHKANTVEMCQHVF
ncbi:hypothetical protein SRHO_G00187340 [Serrasalmus rhombeus]